MGPRSWRCRPREIRKGGLLLAPKAGEPRLLFARPPGRPTVVSEFGEACGGHETAPAVDVVIFAVSSVMPDPHQTGQLIPLLHWMSVSRRLTGRTEGRWFRPKGFLAAAGRMECYVDHLFPHVRLGLEFGQDQFHILQRLVGMNHGRPDERCAGLESGNGRGAVR
jgi:hypothetical protein